MLISPYIAFKGNCRQAIEFYKSALGAEVLFLQTVGESPMSDRGPAENIMHCSMKIGDSTVMVCDDPSPEAPEKAGNMSLAIGLSDPAKAKQLFDNLSQDGSVIMPLDKTFWAAAFGMVTDKFGVRWMVNCDAPK